MQSGALKDLPQSVLDGKCPPNCDHCQIPRFRNLTWILQHKETHEFKHVQGALKWLDLSDKLFRILEGMRISEEQDQLEKLFGDDMEISGGKNICFSPSRVLAVALSIVDRAGYISREKSEILGISSTADVVKDKVYQLSEEQLSGYLPKAKAIIDFVHSDNFPEKLRDTEYGFNLKSVTATYVDLYKFGLLVSAVQVYETWIKAETSVKHTKNSTHQGSSGDKINRELTLYHSFPLFSKWGSADALLFHDNEGNVYRWDTAARPRGLIKNTPFDATMTIKGLSEYQGTKQTLVTRIKFPALDALFALAETAKDPKKFSKILGSIKHNLIYFDGKEKTFWLNRRLLSSLPTQAIVTLLNHPTIKPFWREISEQYPDRLLLDDLVVREAEEQFYSDSAPEPSKSLFPLIRSMFDAGIRLRDQEVIDESFTGKNLKHVVASLNGCEPASNFNLVRYALTFLGQIMPAPQICHADTRNMNRPVFCFSDARIHLYAIDQMPTKDVFSWQTTPIAITEQGVSLYSTISKQDSLREIKKLSGNGEGYMNEKDAVNILMDDIQKYESLLQYPPSTTDELLGKYIAPQTEISFTANP